MGLLVAALLLAQAPPSPPTIEQSLALKTIAAPRISPDGRWIAWTETSTDWDQNAYITQVWVAQRETGERWQLTQAKKSSTAPAWSPDSKLIAFGSDRDGKRQIYLIPPAGGEARAITASETPVGDFHWSPDGKSIAYAAPEAESQAKKDRKDKYGEFEIVENDYTNAALWIVPVEGGAKAQQLTRPADFHVVSFDWSPDGSRIVISAAKDPDLSHRDTTDLYIATVAGKSVQPLLSAPGIENSPKWSPDGREIAYVRSPPEPDTYLNARLMIVPAAGGTPRRIAEKLDENPTLAGWCAGGIYITHLAKTASVIQHIDPASGRMNRLGAGTAASFSSDCSAMTFLAGSPVEVWATGVNRFTPKQLTNQRAQWKDFQIATREVIEWKSEDGTRIEGVLYKPHNFDPKRKYPLLVVIHGGPTGVDTPTIAPDRYYPVEQFVAKDALVLRPNYRGSAGYGEKFRSLNVRNLGIGDSWDILSGIDSLVAKGHVDKDRIGAMGWSQGGYISAFLTCSSDRFKAVSVGAGISDWMTYYVNTDIHPFTRTYLKATPWDDPEIYRKTSPISYVKAAKTPTLIQHGELDKRVPPPNAFELYRALKDRAVESRLVIYKGFGHAIDKPKQMRHVMEENQVWFEKYVLSGR